MKISLLTGSRADAGALVATEHALQRAGVLTEWFTIPAPIVQQDSRLGVANATALACSTTAEYLQQNTPDLVLVHGDRYEVLGAATTAFLMNLPIAHLGGGDTTEGSQDDSIRHAITKLSHLHFATCESSAKRLVQLGENPACVFNVGDPGLDVFFDGHALFSRDAVLKSVGLSDVQRYYLVAFHPNTVGDTKAELMLLVEALKRSQQLLPDTGLVLLDPNKDAGYSLIDQQFERLRGPRIRYCTSLPRTVYLSVLKHAIALIGNSSAAYYEAPSTATWVINVGERQCGRQKAPNCLANVSTVDETIAAMQKAYDNETVASFYNPYGDGFACDRIATVLTSVDPTQLLKKTFYNYPCEGSCLTGFGKRYTLNVRGADTLRRSLYAGSCEPMAQAQNVLHYGSLILAAAQAQAPGFWPGKGSR